MRGGTLLAIFFIISLSAGALLFQNLEITGQVVACTSNWTCSDWSPCIGEKKIRSCIDTNLCGIESGRPQEERTCTPDCIPDWTCRDWQPEECPEDGLQTKSCTDRNNCGTNAGMPESARECEYQETFEWLFWVIVTLNILTIFLTIALLFGLSYKLKEGPRRRIISQKRIPITPETKIPSLGALSIPQKPEKIQSPKTPMSNNPLKTPTTPQTPTPKQNQLPITPTQPQPRSLPIIGQSLQSPINPRTPTQTFPQTPPQPIQPPIKPTQAPAEIGTSAPSTRPGPPKPITPAPNEIMPKSNSPTGFSKPNLKRK